MFGILLTQTSKKPQPFRNEMDHPHNHTGQNEAFSSPDGAEPQLNNPLAQSELCVDKAFSPPDGAEPQLNNPLVQSELCIDEAFLTPPKVTERVEDPDDSFLMIDEDEAMTPSPASSVSGSCSDVRDLELPQPRPLKRKIHIKRAVKKAIGKNEKVQHLTKGIGCVAGSIFGVLGMARITGRKTSLSAKTVAQTSRDSDSESLDSSEDEFNIINIEDGAKEADCQPLDLEPEEFLEYDSDVEFSSESEDD